MTTTTADTAVTTESAVTTEGVDTAEQPTLQRFQPTDLDAAPEVNALLERLGLGRLDQDGLASFGGRNDNWAGRTSGGRQVFVKTVARAAEGGSPQLDRALAFEHLAAHRPAGSPLRTPGHLGSDHTAAVGVYALLPGARSGSELALDDAFDEELCREAGRAVGALHALPADRAEQPEPVTEDAPLPPMPWLEALPWSTVQERSMGQIAAWRLVQDDDQVIAALHALRAAERAAPHAPVHCDLRFDQFLRHDGELYLCDWEEFRLADPARDVGAFAGEWLFHATYAVFAPGAGQEEGPAAGFGLDHAEIIERGAASLRRHTPRITAFWQGYLEQLALEGRAPDAGLAERAAGFAGWHMFDRLLATAELHATLNPVARAAAGIGRTLLLNPSGSVATIGLAQPSGSSR
ncbi:class V lanthionine synthetase subunit LxmK [Streptomyces sp. VNUA116]|uniref:class V lanthionine synthetase subunit LxmK n=1 Tax=Streptomyces sp. VNUA116 TaxID=3062449 RepID=UPI0026771A99|nr:class V lanthionine synthetase subunit LxmK [Streptomyces sp. VNUA116]WKU45664.1 class V lanthionine synthetase subunit LxmK [Streptomyces sp. VNUA116]